MLDNKQQQHKKKNKKKTKKKAFNHAHAAGVIHNDIKSNNVVLEKHGEKWDPFVIDFGKTRLVSYPKPVMELSASAQEEY